ncbi:hypothetical protein CDAR_543311 [Caerostris darwini]|uniref:Uncharacterized protein n=1 Tax=Caerostris darwini TaxID=1538125 RepID=A0AAV4R055_9ARAC|nr:hypothetical protein CDAR_543311 [Caerostris darwini]
MKRKLAILQDLDGIQVYELKFETRRIDDRHETVRHDGCLKEQIVSTKEREGQADFLAVSNLKSRIEFKQIVLHADSRSAIEVIALQPPSESPFVTKVKQNTKDLNMKDKTIVFQLIPSHVVDIDGNENDDQLAKRGT